MQNIKVERESCMVDDTTHSYMTIQPDDGSWIVFTDGSGRPSSYWSQREKDGACVGDGVTL